MVVNTCVLIALLGGILYRLASRIRVPGNANENPTPENGEQDENIRDEERSHLLPFGARCRYLSINNVP